MKRNEEKCSYNASEGYWHARAGGCVSSEDNMTSRPEDRPRLNDEAGEEAQHRKSRLTAAESPPRDLRPPSPLHKLVNSSAGRSKW